MFGTRFLLARDATALRLDGARPAPSLRRGSRHRLCGDPRHRDLGRRIGIPALEELTGSGVYYGASSSEASALSDESVYVVGGGNSAGQAAMYLCRYARQVTLVVRGELADSMSEYLRQALAATSNIEVRHRVEVVDGGGGSRLEWLALRDEVGRDPAGRRRRAVRPDRGRAAYGLAPGGDRAR